MKKLVPILAASASVVTGAVLLSVAAFSNPASNDGKPDTSISASATPSPTTIETGAPKTSAQPIDSSAGKVRVDSPNELNISDVTTNSLKASWTAPTNTVGKVAKYTLLLKENGTGIQTFETTDTSFPFNGLKSNTAYQVEVRAVAVSANGANTATSIPAVSNTVVVRSPDAPDAPVQTPVPTTVSSASPTPSATTDADVAKVVAMMTDYYKFVGSPDNLAKVKEAGKNYSSNSTDAELRKMVADFPEGFKFFDTSSSKSISDSYNELLARTTQSNRTGAVVTVTVPVEAVTVKDGKATIDATKLKVESKGNTTNGTEAPYFEHPQMTLTKNADGVWVLIPEPARQTIP